MRTERELAHVLGHERELELSSHFGSRDELNEERVQILASDSERELAHIFHELLMLCLYPLNFEKLEMFLKILLTRPHILHVISIHFCAK